MCQSKIAFLYVLYDTVISNDDDDDPIALPCIRRYTALPIKCVVLGFGKCMDLGEQQLVEQIRAGDEKAFEGLFRAHYAALRAFSIKFVTDPDAAEEVVQELFFNLWEKRQDLSATQSLRSYLFAAVRNSCLNHLKHLKVRDKHQSHSLSQPLEYADDPGEALQAAELEAMIALAIEGLPDRCGEIFKMSRFGGMKYQEIADALQLSPRTVEVQIGKALKLLRVQLSAYFPAGIILLILSHKWM